MTLLILISGCAIAVAVIVAIALEVHRRFEREQDELDATELSGRARPPSCWGRAK